MRCKAGHRWAAFLLLLGTAPAGAQVLPQSKRDQQRTLAEKLAPLQIDLRPGLTAAASEPTRVLRIRVWAARDYRNQIIGWQSHFRRLVERVNQRVRRWPNVRFELAELNEWPSDSGTGIDDLLRSLQAQDAGDDVDYVVGLATALPLVPDNLHALGAAHVLGKHIILRSLHDLAEYQAVRQHLDLLEDADRERLLAARKS